MKYRKGYKYQLVEDEIFQINILGFNIRTQFIDLWPNGKLIVKSGYAWDGASGPTIDTKSSMRASLGHDALYQLMRNRLLPFSARPHVDDLMLEWLLEDGMWKLRAKLWRREVGKFAGFAVLPKYIKKVYEAP